MKEIIGSTIFFLTMGLFLSYILIIYLPAIQTNPSNSEALINALYWGVGCGIAATIGAMIAKKNR